MTLRVEQNHELWLFEPRRPWVVVSLRSLGRRARRQGSEFTGSDSAKLHLKSQPQNSLWGPFRWLPKETSSCAEPHWHPRGFKVALRPEQRWCGLWWGLISSAFTESRLKWWMSSLAFKAGWSTLNFREVGLYVLHGEFILWKMSIQ